MRYGQDLVGRVGISGCSVESWTADTLHLLKANNKKWSIEQWDAFEEEFEIVIDITNVLPPEFTPGFTPGVLVDHNLAQNTT